VACIKTVNDIVTQPSATSAQQAVKRAEHTYPAPAPPARTPPPEQSKAPSLTSQLIVSALSAVRRATSAAEVRAAAAEMAHAVHDCRNRTSDVPHAQLGALIAGQRAVESKATAKLQSLACAGQEVLPIDGTVFKSGIRSRDGKTEHFANESGSMREQHVHVVEGLDSTEQHTTYDYVRDADGNEYINKR
jgi:hypothetical protein